MSWGRMRQPPRPNRDLDQPIECSQSITGSFHSLGEARNNSASVLKRFIMRNLRLKPR
jgi:hypothetical protein